MILKTRLDSFGMIKGILKDRRDVPTTNKESSRKKNQKESLEAGDSFMTLQDIGKRMFDFHKEK